MNTAAPKTSSQLASSHSAASPKSRFQLSPHAMALYDVITAITFSASGGAPTPLYRHYQEALGLTPGMLTVIFAAYVISLLIALLTVGSLSDYIGRRPVIFAALLLNAAAMVVFIDADSAGLLTTARVVQGFANGAALTTLGATILDTNRTQGPLLNSITAFIGLAVGVLGASALVAFAPLPTQLIYIVLLMLSLIEAVLLLQMPETAARKPGALASLRPDIRVPQQARLVLAQVTPVNVAAWALGGFYFSLMPSLIRVATGLTSPFVGGAIVAALPFAGTIAVLIMRKQRASRMLSIGTPALVVGVVVTLVGVHEHLFPLMLLGTLVAGFGFGSAFSGIVRAVMPLAAANERAGLLSAFYIESYLAFSLPAIAIGLFSPALGLSLSTYIYGAIVVLLALTSLIMLRLAPMAVPVTRRF
jgi:hypothetical protein